MTSSRFIFHASVDFLQSTDRYFEEIRSRSRDRISQQLGAVKKILNEEIPEAIRLFRFMNILLIFAYLWFGKASSDVDAAYDIAWLVLRAGSVGTFKGNFSSMVCSCLMVLLRASGSSPTKSCFIVLCLASGFLSSSFTDALVMFFTACSLSQLRYDILYFVLLCLPWNLFGLSRIFLWGVDYVLVEIRRITHELANDLGPESVLLLMVIPVALVYHYTLWGAPLNAYVRKMLITFLVVVGLYMKFTKFNLRRLKRVTKILIPLYDDTETSPIPGYHPIQKYPVSGMILSGHCMIFLSHKRYVESFLFLVFTLTRFVAVEWLKVKVDLTRFFHLFQIIVLLMEWQMTVADTPVLGHLENNLGNHLTLYYGFSRFTQAATIQSVDDLAKTVCDVLLGNAIVLSTGLVSGQVVFLLFLTIVAVFVRIVSGAGGRRLIVKERESQNFLDHAIKQKFAGTGTAIEIALGDELVQTTLNPDTLRVLRVALNECRLGSVLCHEATLKRQVMDGTYVSTRVTTNMQTMVSKWQSDWRDVPVSFEGKDESLKVSTDWKMVRDILDSLISRGRLVNARMRVTISLVKKKHQVRMVLMLSAGDLITIPKSCFAFAESLGAHLGKKGGSVRLVVPLERGPSKQQGSGSPAPRPANVPPLMRSPTLTAAAGLHMEHAESPRIILPKDLVYAVLDDSNMVRVNLKIIIMRFYHASSKSVFMGETEEEAINFSHLCTQELQPDICILDENLDYSGSPDGRFILGSTIAEDLRAEGFDGVIAMHSANDLLKDTLNYRIVDGFIRKGSSRIVMRNELAKMYHARQELLAQRRLDAFGQ